MQADSDTDCQVWVTAIQCSAKNAYTQHNIKATTTITNVSKTYRHLRIMACK